MIGKGHTDTFFVETILLSVTSLFGVFQEPLPHLAANVNIVKGMDAIIGIQAKHLAVLPYVAA